MADKIPDPYQTLADLNKLQKKHEVLDQFVSRLAADVSRLDNKLKQHLCSHNFSSGDICITCGITYKEWRAIENRHSSRGLNK